MLKLYRITKQPILGIFLILAMLLSGIYAPSSVLAATAPSLGTAGSFAVLGGSTVTNTVLSVINGDLGLSPGTSVTGFPPGIVVSPGTMHVADAAALQAQNDVTIAYNNLASQVSDGDLTGQDLGGLTLTAGVYTFSSSAQLTGTLTLNAENNPDSVFIFQIGSTLTTASNSSVLIINGGSGNNVFWQIGSSATLGTNTAFVGNILALTSITLNTGVSLYGRALARNGAVTLDTNTVTVTVPTFTLTYTAGANGSITGTSPQTVAYGADGAAVTAVPSPGYHFVSWSDASTANPRTDTNVTADITVTASFAIDTYTITASAGANGSIAPSGAVSVNYRADQTFTITPAANYQVNDVLVDGVSVGAVTSYTFTSVTADHTIAASFAIDTQQSPHLSLTKTVSPATYSTVGDVLTYTLVATNDGNVTLTDVFISDAGLTITVSTPAQPTTLVPGDALTVTGTRTITQGNLDSGLLNNTATASGTPPTAGVPVSATASVTATVTATPAPVTGSTTGTVASIPIPSGTANEYSLFLNINGAPVWVAANTTDFPNLLTVGSTLTGILDNSLGWWTFKKG